MSGESAEDTFQEISPIPTIIGSGEKIVYVEFEDEDRRNPQCFPLLKKWAITLTGCYFIGIISAASSSFSISKPSLIEDLHCTNLEAALGLGLYALGYGVVPLVTSSFSEEVGRRPVYIFSSVMFTLASVMVALAPNIETVLAGRTLAGVFGSIGGGLVGGSISDIWQPQDRGLPMMTYAFASLFAMGLGSIIGGVVQSTLGWRWVQWIQVIFLGLLVLLVLVVMCETRTSTILTQIARCKRKTTGSNIYKAKAETNTESISNLFKTSCTRPLYFLLTEPIVQSFSIWGGFTWGVVYCLLEAVTPMFEVIYGFNVMQCGYVYTTSCISAVIGCLANMYQDELYKRHFPVRKQEARLYLVCVVALCLPIGMFIFAWTASPKIHWIVPLIGLTIFMSGVLVIFQVSLLYTADCYNTYTSSAHAGQRLLRYTMATIFPLFTQQMFATLTYRWALMLFAILGLLMAPIPFVLFFYGPEIRARSIASRKILAADAEAHATPPPASSEESSASASSSPPNLEGLDKV